MYFNMSKETISQFTIVKGTIRSRLNVDLALASDSLVEDFFTIVGDKGDQALVDQANLIYRSLREDNQQRLQAKYLKEQQASMLSAYELRSPVQGLRA